MVWSQATSIQGDRPSSTKCQVALCDRGVAKVIYFHSEFGWTFYSFDFQLKLQSEFFFFLNAFRTLGHKSSIHIDCNKYTDRYIKWIPSCEPKLTYLFQVQGQITKHNKGSLFGRKACAYLCVVLPVR